MQPSPRPVGMRGRRMPEFEAGTTYRFASHKGWKTREVESANRPRNLVYLRHVGKLELFRNPTCPWLESFTREQLEDFQITEVRK